MRDDDNRARPNSGGKRSKGSNYVIIICREIIFYDMELLWQLRERNFGKGNMILHCILFPQYW